MEGVRSSIQVSLSTNGQHKKARSFEKYFSSLAAAAATAAGAILASSRVEASPADHTQKIFAELETGAKFPNSIVPPKLADDKSRFHCNSFSYDSFT